ncbi:MAG: hypothetical protein WBP16_17460 [Ferruginibacter sp.]
MNYSFTLKDNNKKGYKLFVWFLFFLHIVAAGVFAINATDKNVQLSIYILLGFFGLVVTLYLLFRKRKKAFETFSLTMALFYANFWLKHVGAIALFIFAAVFLFVNYVQQKKTILQVTVAGVHITRIFKIVVYAWADIENVIVKDGLLTVDLKSNKLIQAEIAEDATVVDENAFNRFCAEQLNSNLNN